MSKKTGFSRYFSGVSYLPVGFVNSILVDKKKSIRAYAFILHDKDVDEEGNLKIPHIHFVFRTYSSWSVDQVSKWFKNYFDENDKPINTLVEVANDVNSCYEYLTHDGYADKYQYSDTALVQYNSADLVVKRDSKDDCMEICEAILKGVPVRELVRMYGKDYVYHQNQYKEVCYDIKIEERFFHG